MKSDLRSSDVSSAEDRPVRLRGIACATLLFLAVCSSAALPGVAHAGAYSDLINSHNPVSYWRLDENGGSTANDEVGPNDGTYVNGVTLKEAGAFADDNNQAVRFDGYNDYTSIPNSASLQLSSPLAILAWVKGDSWGSGSNVNIVVRKGENNPNNYQLAIADGRVSFYLDDGDTGGIRGDTILTTGQWYFVAATWDGSNVRIYVNGQPDRSWPAARGGSIGTDTRNLYIGGRAGTDLFDGVLDEVAIFDKALTSAEIQEIYGAGSGFVGHWKLDETSGTTAMDSSGSGNDGTLNGGMSFDLDSVSPGQIGDALEFNGAGDYISVPNSAGLELTDALTVAAWVKGDSWSSGPSVNAIVRKGEGNPNNYQLAIADGRVSFYLDDGDTGGIRGDTVLATGRWYHVAATWDGSKVRIYVNGQLDLGAAVNRPGAIGTDSRPLYIGGRAWADLFDGVLDDVRLYGYALEPEEIAQLYGLLGHWKFDESDPANEAADSSGNNNHAPLFGDAAWTTGKLGGAIAFDGSGDYATTINDFNPPADGTVVFWMKVPGTPSARQRLFGLGGDWEVRHESSGILTFDLNGEGGGRFETASPVDSPGKWYHIAAVFSATDNAYEVFVDGVLSASGSVTLSQQSAGRLSFGTRTGSWEHWEGTLDDLRVFNRRLSAEEIIGLGAEAARAIRVLKWVEIR